MGGSENVFGFNLASCQQNHAMLVGKMDSWVQCSVIFKIYQLVAIIWFQLTVEFGKQPCKFAKIQMFCWNFKYQTVSRDAQQYGWSHIQFYCVEILSRWQSFIKYGDAAGCPNLFGASLLKIWILCWKNQILSSTIWAVAFFIQLIICCKNLRI